MRTLLFERPSDIRAIIRFVQSSLTYIGTTLHPVEQIATLSSIARAGDPKSVQMDAAAALTSALAPAIDRYNQRLSALHSAQHACGVQLTDIMRAIADVAPEPAGPDATAFRMYTARLHDMRRRQEDITTSFRDTQQRLERVQRLLATHETKLVT
jgi:phage-related minor tail protein